MNFHEVNTHVSSTYFRALPSSRIPLCSLLAIMTPKVPITLTSNNRFFEVYIKYVLICVSFSLLNILFLRFIHVGACHYSFLLLLFFSFLLARIKFHQNILLWEYLLFIHLLLMVIGQADLNILVHIFYKDMLSLLLDIYPGDLLGHRVYMTCFQQIYAKKLSN